MPWQGGVLSHPSRDETARRMGHGAVGESEVDRRMTLVAMVLGCDDPRDFNPSAHRSGSFATQLLAMLVSSAFIGAFLPRRECVFIDSIKVPGPYQESV